MPPCTRVLSRPLSSVHIVFSLSLPVCRTTVCASFYISKDISSFPNAVEGIHCIPAPFFLTVKLYLCLITHSKMKSYGKAGGGFMNFTFSGPCIVIYLLNKDQKMHFAYPISSREYILYMFRIEYSTSRGSYYICSTVIVLAANQHRCTVNTKCCIYSNCLLMMNSYYIRNM